LEQAWQPVSDQLLQNNTVERTRDGQNFESLTAMPVAMGGHCMKIVDSNTLITAGGNQHPNAGKAICGGEKSLTW
jgi:hypothetical protein